MLLDVVAEPEGVALGGAAPLAQHLHAGRGSHAGRALSPLRTLAGTSTVLRADAELGDAALRGAALPA